MKNIKQKLITGIVAVGIGLAVLCGGCESQQITHTLTREQEEAILRYRTKEAENEKKQANAIIQYRIKTQNQNYPVKTQEERNSDVVDEMLSGFGADMATTGILKAITDYSK